jgi:hypothetical protein
VTFDRLIGLKYWAGEDIGIIKVRRCFWAFAYFRLFSYVILYINLDYLTTVFLRFWSVNVILQTFRTVDRIQYELFRPFTVPYHFWTLHDSFWAFPTVLWRSFAFMDNFIIYIYYYRTPIERVLPKAFLHL